mmetsp:Transcript_30843/g.68097  ORF Transcript_30843/g.68097 Transcript_30843/m.68097 type:complete len:234 (-) Transcript_30843:41-742(-)
MQMQGGMGYPQGMQMQGGMGGYPQQMGYGQQPPQQQQFQQQQQQGQYQQGQQGQGQGYGYPPQQQQQFQQQQLRRNSSVCGGQAAVRQEGHGGLGKGDRRHAYRRYRRDVGWLLVEQRPLRCLGSDHDRVRSLCCAAQLFQQRFLQLLVWIRTALACCGSFDRSQDTAGQTEEEADRRERRGGRQHQQHHQPGSSSRAAHQEEVLNAPGTPPATTCYDVRAGVRHTQPSRVAT